MNTKNKTPKNALSEPYCKADVVRGSLLVIGDVHGKIDNYWNILQKHRKGRSIQVGDFGFKKQHDWHLKNISYLWECKYGNN